MQEELWKPVYGYENLYDISNKGNIRNTKRNKLLHFGKNNKGYLLTTLWKSNSQKTFTVHKLVAQMFVANPENKQQVNHKDGFKENNHADNLEWVSCRENILHSVQTGTFKRTCRNSG